MDHSQPSAPPRSSAPVAVLLALLLVYLSWGTTYLAIREGVKYFPPALFGGTRVGLAGLALLGFLAVRRAPLRLSAGRLAWLALVGAILFVCGNGLMTLAEKTVESGEASLLAATTPLWMALFETVRPRGERLTLRGWFGLFAGLAGLVLLVPLRETGPPSPETSARSSSSARCRGHPVHCCGCGRQRGSPFAGQATRWSSAAARSRSSAWSPGRSRN
jgi:drug/metabolite transporter (DMT)-like permease